MALAPVAPAITATEAAQDHNRAPEKCRSAPIAALEARARAPPKTSAMVAAAASTTERHDPSAWALRSRSTARLASAAYIVSDSRRPEKYSELGIAAR